jgi:hypothetical protein
MNETEHPRDTAVHETAHAVIAELVGAQRTQAWLTPNDDITHGRMSADVPRSVRATRCDKMRYWCRVGLGGPFATELLNGKDPSRRDPRAVLMQEGLGNSAEHGSVYDYVLDLAKKEFRYDDEARQYLDVVAAGSARFVIKNLRHNWKLILRRADQLLRDGEYVWQSEHWDESRLETEEPVFQTRGFVRLHRAVHPWQHEGAA